MVLTLIPASLSNILFRREEVILHQSYCHGRLLTNNGYHMTRGTGAGKTSKAAPSFSRQHSGSIKQFQVLAPALRANTEANIPYSLIRNLLKPAGSVKACASYTNVSRKVADTRNQLPQTAGRIYLFLIISPATYSLYRTPVSFYTTTGVALTIQQDELFLSEFIPAEHVTGEHPGAYLSLDEPSTGSKIFMYHLC